VKLRPYQITAKADINAKYAEGHRVVALKMDTGSGKTPTFASVMMDEPGASIVIAHRGELGSQASVTFARYGVRHRIIGQQSLIKLCSQLHIAEFGKNYVDPNAKIGVASVNTLVNKRDPWFNQVRLWVIDETHHLVKVTFGAKRSRCSPTLAAWE